MDLKMKLDEVGTELLDFLQEGVDFAGEQIPLVLEEILKWETWQAGVGVFLCGLGIVIFLALTPVLKRSSMESRYGEEKKFLDWEDFTIKMALSALCFLSWSVPIFVVNLLTIIKISVAPRLFLIERVSDILK